MKRKFNTGLVAISCLALFCMSGCASTATYRPDYLKESHKQQKAEGHSFLDRNQEQWWAQPFLLIDGIRQFDATN